jgi:predicted regulator of Ras-like GTPase activity (Roadblock/LC7/MglB family)
MDADLLNDALVSLRDIPGVDGAFVIDEFGRLIGLSGSAIFPADAVERVAQKVSMLAESAAESFGGAEEVHFAFEGHYLIVRKGVFGALAILADRTCNIEGVRMGGSVVARRINMLQAQGPAVSRIVDVSARPPVAHTLRGTGVTTGGNPPAREVSSSKTMGGNKRVASLDGRSPVPSSERRQPPPPSSSAASGPRSTTKSAESANPKTPPKKSDIWG